MGDDRNLGARIKPEQPVERLSSEGPLDQALLIHVDDRLKVPVYLESVLGVKDLMERCPGLGEIDLEKLVNSESIKSLLGEDSYILDDLFLDPNGDGYCAATQATRDQFGVSDDKWLSSPDDLIWKSSLTAQLHAKYNAISHFLNSAGAVGFGATLTEDQRRIVAARARQLAVELKDEALRDVSASIDKARDALNASMVSSKENIARFVVTQKADIDRGGFTQGDLDSLYPGGL